VYKVEQKVRVGPLHRRGSRVLFLVCILTRGSRTVLLLPGEGGERLREAKVEIDRLSDDKEQGHARGRGKGVGGDRSDGAQPGAKGWTKGEGDGEAGADQGHGCAAAVGVRDIRRNGRGELHIALGETADNARGQKGAEVDGHDPQEHREDVAHHAGQQGRAAAILVREVPDDGRGKGLEETVAAGLVNLGLLGIVRSISSI